MKGTVVNSTDMVSDLVEMSHRLDPHTSVDAARRALRSGKVSRLHGAIVAILRDGPATPGEVLVAYHLNRQDVGWLDANVDLQDIRRRMTELERRFGRIEPIQAGTHKGGAPQWVTRDGARVMRLTEAGA